MNQQDLKRHLKELLQTDNRFAGIGITSVDGEVAIKVNRTHGKPFDIPKSMHGITIVQDAVGRIDAL